MTKKFTHGFTLIELLVVIAIIGILSSVVLASLNTARNKGADAAIKSNLSNMRSQVEILFGDNGIYNGVCTAQNPQAMYDASCRASVGAICTDNTNGHCWNNASNWGAWVQLKYDTTRAWCVDYTGASRQVPKPAPNIVICPP